MSPGCPTKLILVEFLPCFPGSALAGRDPLAPWCHTWSRTSATAVTQPRSWAGPAEHRDSALSAGEFMSCRCLPSAENTSGKCGSEIFPQLPRPCCERPCSRRPSLEGPAGLGAAAGSGTGCLIKKGKLLPAEAAHSRLGHVGSTSIYSPFSPSQGSGSELPAWQLSCSFPTLTSTILNPFLCPGALSGGGDHPPPQQHRPLQNCWAPAPFSPLSVAALTRAVSPPREAVDAGGSAGCGVSACCTSWRDHTGRVRVRSVTTELCFATGNRFLALPPHRAERAGYPHRLWAPQGLPGAVERPQGASCTGWRSVGSEMEPGTAHPSANLPLAALRLGLRAPALACVTPPARGKGGARSWDLKIFWKWQQNVTRCRAVDPPERGGTPVLCRRLSAPCNSLHGGCGLTGRGRQRAGFHVKRAIKGRNLLTWRSV